MATRKMIVRKVKPKKEKEKIKVKKIKLKFKGDPTRSIRLASDEEKKIKADRKRHEKSYDRSPNIRGESYDRWQENLAESEKVVRELEAFKKKVGVKKGGKLSKLGKELYFSTSVKKQLAHEDKVKAEKKKKGYKATVAEERAKDKEIAEEKEKRRHSTPKAKEKKRKIAERIAKRKKTLKLSRTFAKTPR